MGGLDGGRFHLRRRVHLLLPVRCDFALADTRLWLPIGVADGLLVTTATIAPHLLHLEFDTASAAFSPPMRANHERRLAILLLKGPLDHFFQDFCDSDFLRKLQHVPIVGRFSA